jgi:AraC-like DNA-binding protein
MTDYQARMCALFDALIPEEGYVQSRHPSVYLARAHQPASKTQALYEPSILIMLQGAKRVFIGDEVYVYNAQQYMVMALPLPCTSEAQASAQEPLMGLSIRLNLTEVADLLVSINEAGIPQAETPRGAGCTPLDDRLSQMVLRLLEGLGSPLETRLLTPGHLREIYYHVLMGPQGPSMRAALTSQGHFGKIAKALRWINAHYAEDIDVSRLAQEAGMSVAAFHAHFKTISQTTPIQYIKSTRLHQARLLMVRSQLSAAHAAAEVGYESASQFSREFKRFFGRSPGEEAARLNESLSPNDERRRPVRDVTPIEA